jgi:hypothetical protein
MLLYGKGSSDTVIDSEELKNIIFDTFSKLVNKNKVLAIPPDFTRYHSRAGEITEYSYDYFKKKMTDILPALGTHYPMTES